MISARKNSLAMLMFALGLFSQTHVQIIGSIAITELLMFVIAPIVYLSNAKIFRRERCGMFLFLLGLSIVGCLLSSWYNHIDWVRTLKGVATPYGFWASFVVFYLLLRRDPHAFKWYLLAEAISFVTCTFVFQQAYDLNESMGRGGGAEAIMSGPIYWIGRISGFVTWPVRGLYMHVPTLASVVATLFMGFFSILTTASGRSSALISLASAAMIIYAGRNVTKMRAIRKHFVACCIVAIVFVGLFKTAYSYSARTGLLGADAKAKYESQTRGGTSTLQLLKGGRGEMFLGLYYCFRRPIMGYGPWAFDEDFVCLDYIAKYGLPEDYADSYDSKMRALAAGKKPLVGAHSACLQFWLMSGILGMPIWLYIAYLMYDYFRRRIGAVPQFFGYFACVLPGLAWSVFFSPFGGRLGWGFMFAMLLINREMSKFELRASSFMCRG